MLFRRLGGCQGASSRLTPSAGDGPRAGPAHELRGRRLVIVGDGACTTRRFAMLLFTAARARSEGLAGQRGSQTPLIVNHEIVMLRSASTLGIMRMEPRDVYTGAATGIAVGGRSCSRAADDRPKGDWRLGRQIESDATAAAEDTRLLAHLSGAPR